MLAEWNGSVEILKHSVVIQTGSLFGSVFPPANETEY